MSAPKTDTPRAPGGAAGMPRRTQSACSLWPTFCGRRKTKQDYWDLQLCEKKIVQMAMDTAANHRCGAAAPAACAQG